MENSFLLLLKCFHVSSCDHTVAFYFICVMSKCTRSCEREAFFINIICLTTFPRSPEMLRSEGSYSTGERHSSTDSNKASSGDVSPYDNNSPVLSERSLMATQEEVAHSPDKPYRVPEQYTLGGHLQPKTKENSSASQAGKGISSSCSSFQVTGGGF